MTILEMKRIIRSHYGLTRAVTDREVFAELAMLRRTDSLDDRKEMLRAQLDRDGDLSR